MKARSKWLFVAVLLACVWPVQGMFAPMLTHTVPIERVMTNLNARLAKDSNSVETLYSLARVHSMAFSTNLTMINVATNWRSHLEEPAFEHPAFDTGVPASVVRFTNAQAHTAAKQHLTNAIAFYRRAAALVFKGTNASENKWLIPPIHLGLAWCLEQDGRREEAIRAYRRALQLAWDMEIEPTPSLKEQAEWSWDKIRAKQNPFTKPPRGLGPGVIFSREIIGYLKKLLDPVKDAKEIAQLDKDLKTINGMPRAITPILVPLENNLALETLVDPTANVAFDLDGSGLQRHWGWITTNAAWLVYDHDGRGQISSGLQMFGGVTFWVFWRDGYAALSSLDDNSDGKLSGDELNGISLWRDLNGNGVADPGEVLPVKDYGIISINCRRELHASGIPFNPAGIEFRNGSTRPTYDWMVPSMAPGVFTP